MGEVTDHLQPPLCSYEESKVLKSLVSQSEVLRSPVSMDNKDLFGLSFSNTRDAFRKPAQLAASRSRSNPENHESNDTK